jgi:transposase
VKRQVKRETAVLSVMHPLCCGLDVHKDTVNACLLRRAADGTVHKVSRVFGTTTKHLTQLADWLLEEGCRVAAMESTGVYWRPVYNILEEVCDTLLLLNAQHVKNLPGRKTDVSDAEWIGGLLQYGLVRGSFIPPQAIRDLRDLTRYRTTLIRQRANECNRIQKLLESANIKLASVATDVLGVTGRDILEALASGNDDPKEMAKMARGKLRSKMAQLVMALEGKVRDHHRWLLRQHLDQIAHLDEAIATVDAKVGELTAPFERQIALLDQITGVSRRVAEIILAEIGIDMSRFPSPRHLASWACLCPGNNESAGKRKSGKTRKGSHWLRTALVEAGWAASHSKSTYLAEHYHRIARRRGRKRACVATAHTILVIVHRMLSDLVEYRDLGADFYERHTKEETVQGLISRIHKLGYNVALQPRA